MSDKVYFEFDNYIFDLYGTLIDIHTDEHCDETWKKWIAVLDRKGIKHPELNRFRTGRFLMPSSKSTASSGTEA